MSAIQKIPGNNLLISKFLLMMLDLLMNMLKIS